MLCKLPVCPYTGPFLQDGISSCAHGLAPKFEDLIQSHRVFVELSASILHGVANVCYLSKVFALLVHILGIQFIVNKLDDRANLKRDLCASSSTFLKSSLATLILSVTVLLLFGQSSAVRVLHPARSESSLDGSVC